MDVVVVVVVPVVVLVVVVVNDPGQRDEVEDAPDELADARDQEQHSGLQVGS